MRTEEGKERYYNLGFCGDLFLGPCGLNRVSDEGLLRSGLLEGEGHEEKTTDTEVKENQEEGEETGQV